MYLVRKGDTVMGARDDVQLAAFLNAGWDKLEMANLETRTVEVEKPKPETIAEPTNGTGDADNADVTPITPTKTDINRMTTANLREYGDKIGIVNAFDKNGAVLKEEIIAKLGL